MAKAKGTTLISLVKFLRSHAGGAREHLSPELHGYLETRIQTALWYPEEDVLALLRCMVELVPAARQTALAQMGVRLAQEHLEGVYEHLRGGVEDLNSLHRRSYALWSTMHDSGKLSVRSEGPDSAHFELRDYALPSPEMCSILTAYFTETLRLSGAVEPEVEETSCRLQGAGHCGWQAHWRGPSS